MLEIIHIYIPLEEVLVVELHSESLDHVFLEALVL